MQGKYEVTHGGRTVGTVELKAEGLYYRLYCRCQVPDGRIHRLYGGDEKLGVLIPDGDGLVLTMRVASKRLASCTNYYLDRREREFVPICRGEEFAYLRSIRKGKLVFRGGNPGIYPAD